MPNEKTTLDAALAAFKAYRDKGRLDVKTKIERIKTLQEAVKTESARIRATKE